MAAATRVNCQWRLKSRPTGLIKADNFELVSQLMPVPEEGQFLIRSVYLSLDPALRGWPIDRPLDGLKKFSTIITIHLNDLPTTNPHGSDHDTK